MSLAFWWCHTWGCPDYGRPRKIETAEAIRCGYCGADRRAASPEDHAMNDAAPGER